MTTPALVGIFRDDQTGQTLAAWADGCIASRNGPFGWVAEYRADYATLFGTRDGIGPSGAEAEGATRAD